MIIGHLIFLDTPFLLVSFWNDKSQLRMLLVKMKWLKSLIFGSGFGIVFYWGVAAPFPMLKLLVA
jgi:hypothetical protein